MRGHRLARRTRRYGYALFAMARPGFLLGSVPLYLVGLAVARAGGHSLGWPAALAGLLLVVLVQLATHYNNEYHDRAVDAATRPTRLAGGSRVLPRGIVPPRTARMAALGCLLAAVVVAVSTALAFDAGPAFLALAAGGVAVGWFYSSPPVALAARGVGEASVALVTGLLVPAVAYVLQASSPGWRLLEVCLPLVSLAFAVSLATAVPDVEADRRGGKLTLAARLGPGRAMRLHAVALLAGTALFARLAVSLDAALGATAALALFPVLAAYVRYVPGAARGSVAAAERVALVSVATLGWASAATAALLVV